MIYREQWEYRPEWADYVFAKWRGTGRVEQITDDSIGPFRQKAWDSFEKIGFPIKRIKTWINIMVPDSRTGYDDGYPHVHYPLDGLTLVHYLEPGDSPAPLHIFDNDEVIEIIYPVKGLTVFMPNDLKHGVLRNNGTIERMAMIATALRG